MERVAAAAADGGGGRGAGVGGGRIVKRAGVSKLSGYR